MFVSKDIKQRVVDQLKESIAVAEKRYGITVRFPKVTYTKRGTTAGTADYRNYVIDLNPVLLNENEDAFIARTVIHELAHLIDHQLNPENFKSYDPVTGRRKKRSVHGRTWKGIMVALGADPSRCHSFDVSNTQVKRKSRYTWTCKCGDTMVLGPVRHKRQLRTPTYWMRGHKRCGGYTFGQPRAIAAETPEAPVAAKPTKPTKSWKEIGVEVYGRTDSRAQFISTMVKLGLKKSTASTYHHNCKSGKWV